MNKNQTEVENAVDKNDTHISDTLSSRSSSFKDLYDDLLTTLNTPAKNTSANAKSTPTEKSTNIPKDNKDNRDTSETKEIKKEIKEPKKFENTAPKEKPTDRRNIDPVLRSSSFSELLTMIDTTPDNKSKESGNDNPTLAPTTPDYNFTPSNTVSADNSFKDDILNSEIFDSVFNDINKQKIERTEKKKERENRSNKTSSQTYQNKTTADSGEAEFVKEWKPAKEREKITNTQNPFDSRQYSENTDSSKENFRDREENKQYYTVSDSVLENIEKDAEENVRKKEYDERNTPPNPKARVPKPSKRNEISDEDRLSNGANNSEDELLKAFGFPYEEEINGAGVGVKRRATHDNKIKVATKSKTKLKAMHQIASGEYTSREQNDAIFSEYKRVYTSEWTKLIICTVCLLVLLYLELAPYIKLPLPYFLDIKFYNVIYVLLDLQILLVVAWLNSDSLIFGIKSIFASVVNIYYITVFFFALTFIHTIATYFWKYNAPDMVLFNSITVFAFVLMSLYNLLDINIEIMGFKVISSKKLKYAVYMNENSVLEMDGFRDIIPENTVVGNISRTDFISNFFSRTNKNKVYGLHEKYFLAVSASVSALLFAALLGFKVDKYTALSSAVTVMLCSVPFCSVIVNIFPIYKAQKKAYAMSSAIIGSDSVNNHSEVSIISVYDRDIFPPEQAKMSGMQVYGNNNRLETVLQHLCAIFEKLNLSIADVFKSSTTYEENFDRNIDVLSVADNGVCFISNRRKLFMGNSEYVSNIGLAVNYDKNFDEQFQKSSGSILFLSSDREVIAKIYIKYEIVPEFFDIIKSLNKANICLGIRTFDPNIDNTLLHRIANFKKFPVKVIKLKDLRDIYQPPNNIDSGVASKSTLKSFIRTFLLCDKTKNIIKSNVLIQIIAFIAGLGITSIVAVLGIINGEIWTINPGYILLFQVFWMLPILFLSGLTPN